MPWVVLQGEIDQVCAPADTTRFVAQVGSGRLVSLPKVGHGFSVTRAGSRSTSRPTARSRPRRRRRRRRRSHGTADAARRASPGWVSSRCPRRRPARDLIAILLSGDGGWAGIDKQVAAGLAAQGVRVVGWSSLKYYWQPRTPEGAARDLARVIEHYRKAWATPGGRPPRVLLVGYSFGADVLPFLATRLAPELRSQIARVALLGLSPDASFEFHVTDWLGLDEGRHATVPEVERLGSTPVLCLRGDDETDSACDAVRSPSLRVVTLPGGHHFGGDYARIARLLVDGIG